MAKSPAMQLPDFRIFPEPELSFHPDRPQDCDVHPLRGLVEFGPYSRSLVNSVMDPIRVAAIVPHGRLRAVEHLLHELERTFQPRERPQYLVDFQGFSRIFGLRAVLARDAVIQLPGSLNDEVQAADRPHLLLAEKLTQALSSLQSYRTEFDVALVLLPDNWESGFFGPDDEDFDLHDFLKALSATRAIPLQVIRESGALTYHCRASVMWRLSIALYTKAGGVPWKIADAEPDVAFVGLSYALRPNAVDQPRFVTCCSQVFDADGAGLEFIAYETNNAKVVKENPFLSRSEMRRVIGRSLALYQRRHASRPPRRLVIHKSTEFKTEEVDGCFEAWQSTENLDLIHVQQDTFWRGVLLDQPQGGGTKGEPARYPCRRGTVLQLGGRDVLLWTQGNAPSVAKKGDFFKEGKGIPAPLLLVRYGGHGSFDDSCRAVLGLTKMDWNNDALYNQLPVTMSYAGVLARTIRRMPTISPRAYEFRFFM